MNLGHIILRDLKETNTEQCADRVYGKNDIPKLQEDLKAELDEISEIKFITGNLNKVQELTRSLQLKHVNLTCTDIDLVEIQGSDEFAIIQDKCQRAYEAASNELSNARRLVTLVDDTSLDFSALGGMPGPYVKWFLEAMGPAGLVKMLAGFEDKSAKAICTYALMLSERWMVFFRGIARGQIVEPRGDLGWGWDLIFEEQESRKTFGEMLLEEKAKFSHRGTAVELLAKFLAKN